VAVVVVGTPMSEVDSVTGRVAGLWVCSRLEPVARAGSEVAMSPEMGGSGGRAPLDAAGVCWGSDRLGCLSITSWGRSLRPCGDGGGGGCKGWVVGGG
jgi:hypothetical protein